MSKKNKSQFTSEREVTVSDVQNTNSTPEIDKFELITSLCREGIPSYMLNTTISIIWENKKISLDIRDCDILDSFRFPVPGQERRSDFVVPHFLGLSAEYVYLPCEVDGEKKVMRFQHLKASKLLNAYFAKIREYAKTLSDVIERINNMSDDEYLTFLHDKVIDNKDFQNRIKL